MNEANPMLDDYKLLVVFKNIGLKLIQEVKVAMSRPPYNGLFKCSGVTEQNEMLFSYLEQPFKLQIEVFFNQTRMPKTAQLTSYFLQPDKTKRNEEIIRYTYDLDYNVNDIYTLDNFASHYLIEFHQNVKKTFSDNHVPFGIRFSGK